MPAAVYVINVPKVFAVVFSMIKSLLNETTVNKFRVFDCNSEKWKAALLEEINANQLPVYYGGTQRDPDGNAMCLSKVNHQPANVVCAMFCKCFILFFILLLCFSGRFWRPSSKIIFFGEQQAASERRHAVRDRIQGQ